MDKAKRARTAETPKQPSLGLKLRAPCLYPDRGYSAITNQPTTDGVGRSAESIELGLEHPTRMVERLRPRDGIDQWQHAGLV
jgi:hypothetical protein